MDAPPQHTYMRPPQSYMSDLQQQQVAPPRPPPANWYPPNNNNNNNNQFQYQHNHSSYPTPQPPPYPTQPQNHYYPPPPPPPPQSYPQQSLYSQPPPPPHQTWGNPNWAQQNVWPHPDRTEPNINELDWAAKARAWAAAKSAGDSQHQQSQSTQIGRPEEHNHDFHGQYQQTVDPHYANIQQQPLPASSHQQFMGDPYMVPANHQQESLSFSSGPSLYYPSDLQVSYTSRDGALAPDPSPYLHQANILTNSSIYQQEVPYSYSSAPGKGESRSQDGIAETQSSLPITAVEEAQQRMQPTLSASGQYVSEEPYFTFGSGAADPLPDMSDQPLKFTPGFSHNHQSHDQHPQSSYMHPDPAAPVGYVDHVTAVPSNSALTPIVPARGYQFDPSFVPPVPVFGQISGPNFRHDFSAGGVAFGVNAGTVHHPLASFPGDTNGINSVSDRPKKASVPNWLREEIIKKKAVIGSSSQENLEEDPSNPTEDDNSERSSVKRGPAENKSIDSSRSSDDEEDDEDDIEAAHTAAVNQEIKRVLTEVLLKVTDELFDEIATKVLNEDDLAVEVDHSISPPNHTSSQSPPTTPAAKASSRILIEAETKDDAIVKSPFNPGGDVLGLGSYASDDDDYDETQSSSRSITRKTDAPPVSNNLLVEMPQVNVNGGSRAEIKGPSGTIINTYQDKNILTKPFSNSRVMGKLLTSNESDKPMNFEIDNISILHKGVTPSREDSVTAYCASLVATDGLKLRDVVGGRTPIKPDLPQDVAESLTDVSQVSNIRSKSDKTEEQEIRNSSRKESNQEAESCSLKSDSKLTGYSETRRDERHAKKEISDDRNGKGRVKDEGTTPGEKVKGSDSRKNFRSKDEKTESEKVKKDGATGERSQKRSREKDEKEDRLRHQRMRDSSKRRHSPSVGGRVRNTRDSSDEDSDDSRLRKKHSRKRSLSPSSTRSRRRQISRSPHSKHSHRRNSPYSSIESKRGRSRSNSPVHRRR